MMIKELANAAAIMMLVIAIVVSTVSWSNGEAALRHRIETLTQQLDDEMERADQEEARLSYRVRELERTHRCVEGTP